MLCGDVVRKIYDIVILTHLHIYSFCFSDLSGPVCYLYYDCVQDPEDTAHDLPRGLVAEDGEADSIHGKAEKYHNGTYHL